MISNDAVSYNNSLGRGIVQQSKKKIKVGDTVKIRPEYLGDGIGEVLEAQVIESDFVKEHDLDYPKKLQLVKVRIITEVWLNEYEVKSKKEK